MVQAKLGGVDEAVDSAHRVIQSQAYDKGLLTGIASYPSKESSDPFRPPCSHMSQHLCPR
jgi:hypothetical protein